MAGLRRQLHGLILLYDVSRCFTRYDGDMKCKRTSGRGPRKVSDEEMHWIAQAVRNHTPLQFELEYGLWRLSLIARLIHRQFGKSLSLASVSRIMKLPGFSAQKLLY